MPKAPSRPSLPASSSEFALPKSSSNADPTLTGETVAVLPRFRRPSILIPKAGYLTEARLVSPLAASPTIYPSQKRRKRHDAVMEESSECHKEGMFTISSPSSSSQDLTPPESSEDNEKETAKMPSFPFSTPPRKLSSSNMDMVDLPFRTARRLSVPLRTPRILNILAESRITENEVQSEAAFQRLVTSQSGLPMQVGSPRGPSDRGRYPEEAVQDDFQREETSSDDSYEEEQLFAFQPSATEPIRIGKPRTPAPSTNGDDLATSWSESPGVSSVSMDVDMLSGSPTVTPLSQWRYTPPSTSSAARTNKRKLDDRYDPYPSASKRRAVSPRDHLISPIIPGRTQNGPSRVPKPIPITIPKSTASSAASSPSICGSYPTSGLTLTRPLVISSSPTLRGAISLASPISRPLRRASIRRNEEEEKEVEGAGEAVGDLSID